MDSLALPATPGIHVVPLADLMRVDREWSRGHAHHRFLNTPPGAPGRIEFGPLRLFALETVDAGHGYSLHPHDNVEVITLILSGTALHRDSIGGEVAQTSEVVAVMSAGSGIQHAEYASHESPCRLVQIWLEPRRRDTPPRADHAHLPRAERLNRLQVMVSGRASDQAPLYVDQDAVLFSAVLERGARVAHPIHAGRCAYVVPASAAIRLNHQHVQAGERVLASEPGTLGIAADDRTEVLVLDLPRSRD